MDQIADVVAPRSEDPKLIIGVINFELVEPICPRYVNVTDGRTDRRTDDYRALHYVHRAVMMVTGLTVTDNQSKKIIAYLLQHVSVFASQQHGACKHMRTLQVVRHCRVNNEFLMYLS